MPSGRNKPREKTLLTWMLCIYMPQICGVISIRFFTWNLTMWLRLSGIGRSPGITYTILLKMIRYVIGTYSLTVERRYFRWVLWKWSQLVAVLVCFYIIKQTCKYQSPYELSSSAGVFFIWYPVLSQLLLWKHVHFVTIELVPLLPLSTRRYAVIWLPNFHK